MQEPPSDRSSPSNAELTRLLEVLARLRAPGGCPWDREQTELSMAPHLLEETYEAVEALEAGSCEKSCEELGDVLMNVLMIAQIASEAGRFDCEDVARGIADKLVRRHPHVFGDSKAKNTDEVLANWEAIKQTEGTEPRSVLAGVPAALPALLKSYRIGEKASRAGFDWPTPEGPRGKLGEELGELDAAIRSKDKDQIEEELGDLLFSVVNLARHLDQNPEMALRKTIDKFVHRFRHVEERLGTRLSEASIEEMEALWNEAKSG